MQVNKLLADIVHINLNARGGSERLAVATMKALICYRQPISFDLTIGKKPVLVELKNPMVLIWFQFLSESEK